MKERAGQYKGDSLSKKLARHLTHHLALERLKIDHLSLAAGGLHAFLASREGGDIATLRSLGISYNNMLALDQDPGALLACFEKWEEKLEGFSGPMFCNDDAALAICDATRCITRVMLETSPQAVDKRFHSDLTCNHSKDDDTGICKLESWARRDSSYPAFASVFLDFCAPLNRETVLAITNAWAPLPVGAVFSLAVLKGRERMQSVAKVPLDRAMNRQARRIRKSLHEPSYILLLDMLRGVIPWDVERVLAEIGGELGGATPEMKRSMFVYDLLFATRSEALPLPIASIQYQSKTAEGNGVPMLILMYEKISRSGQAPERPGQKHLLVTHEHALDWRNRVLKENAADKASLILNMPRKSVIALKAHVSRGTYSRESA